MILPAHPSIGIKKDVPVIGVALVQMCNAKDKDASTNPIQYKDGNMESVCAFSVATIDCVIGRVKMGKWWGIADRSIGPLRNTIYDIQEPEYELEYNFSISCGV